MDERKETRTSPLDVRSRMPRAWPSAEYGNFGPFLLAKLPAPTGHRPEGASSKGISTTSRLSFAADHEQMQEGRRRSFPAMPPILPNPRGRPRNFSSETLKNLNSDATGGRLRTSPDRSDQTCPGKRPIGLACLPAIFQGRPSDRGGTRTPGVGRGNQILSRCLFGFSVPPGSRCGPGQGKLSNE